jgi:hypothetical protein
VGKDLKIGINFNGFLGFPFGTIIENPTKQQLDKAKAAGTRMAVIIKPEKEAKPETKSATKKEVKKDETDR